MEQRKKKASKLELGLGENLLSLGRIVLGVSYTEAIRFIGLLIYASHGRNELNFGEVAQYMSAVEASIGLVGPAFGAFIYAFGSDFREEKEEKEQGKHTTKMNYLETCGN